MEFGIALSTAARPGDDPAANARHIEEDRIEPNPDRPIPIWTGSYGDRSLGVTARLADGWNPSMPYLPPEAAAAKWERLRASAAEAGRNPDDITCSYNVWVYVDEK